MSPSEGEILIEIMNDYGLEQLVPFPTRERNTLDLIITSLRVNLLAFTPPTGSVIIKIVSGTLKVVIPPLKNLRGRCIDIRKVIIKDVNGYSNIRIRSEYSNTISEFEYSHLFSVPAFFVIFLLFCCFFL